MSTDDQVEFKWVDAKLIGSDTVAFRLEDGALVKVKVDINRAGVATTFTNPDGSPHYNVAANIIVTTIPPDKKFKVPKSSLQAPQLPARKPPTGQVS